MFWLHKSVRIHTCINLRYHSSEAILLGFGGLFLGPETSWLGLADCQWTPLIFLSVPSSAGITSTFHHTQLFMLDTGIEFGSSWLCSKHLTNGIICPEGWLDHHICVYLEWAFARLELIEHSHCGQWILPSLPEMHASTLSCHPALDLLGHAPVI